MGTLRKLGAVALATSAALFAAPESADAAAAVPVVARWWSAPPESDCATSVSEIEVLGYAGAAANPGVPVNAGSAQLFTVLTLTPTDCESGTVTGFIEYFEAGPARVQGPILCPVGNATGTYERTGPVLAIQLSAHMFDSACPFHDPVYDNTGYIVPITARIALTREDPMGAGVVAYGVAL